MISNTDPILPGQSLGGIQLGSKLAGLGTVWQVLDDDFPWEISWLDRDVHPSKFLRPWVTTDFAVVAFLDEASNVRGLYATPHYEGALFGEIYTDMTAAEILRLKPNWLYSDMIATIADPEQPGFYLKHEEDDLYPDQVSEARFHYIGVFDPTGPYFL